MHDLDDSYPCSYQQLDRLRWKAREPGSWFVSGVEASCAWPVPADAFVAAVAELARRHGALRTSFRCDATDLGTAVADVLADDPRALLRISRPADGELAVTSTIDTPLDPAGRPMWRATLRSKRLLFEVDHLVFDGTSAIVLLGELATLCAGQPDAGPLPDGTYADFARWQRDEYTRSEAGPDLDYWAGTLAGVLERPVVLDGFDPDGALRSSATQKSRSLRIGEDVWPRLAAGCVRAGGTAFTAIAAPMLAALAAASTTPDVTVYCPVAARPFEHDKTIGWFANLMPLRVQRGTAMSGGEWVDAVRSQVFDAIEHWLMPWDLMRSGFGADPAAPPRPGLALLNVVDAQTPAAASRHGWSLVQGESVMSQAGLDVQVRLGRDSARMTCNYPATGYHDQAISDFIRGVEDSARRLCEELDR